MFLHCFTATEEAEKAATSVVIMESGNATHLHTPN
jgi:hypothetical protein